MSVGERLRQARQETGLTLENAADLLGTSANMIWRYEAGQRHPSSLALFALGTLYNKSVEWILGEGDEFPVSPSWLGNRLREARFLSGLSIETVAAAIGVTPTTIRRHEVAQKRPSTQTLHALANVYKKGVGWFLGEAVDDTEAQETATRPTTDSSDIASSLSERLQEFSARFDRLETYIRAQAPVQAIAESRTGYDPSNYEPSDRSPVRLLEVASAAGVGAEVYDETPIGLLWFRNDWLQNHSIDPKQSHIISVRGESMEPTLPDGCSILVDRSQGRRRRRVGRIFVMRTEDGLVVKRAGKDAEGNWQIESDNEDWEPVPWSRDAEVIGEVRWYGVTVSGG